MRKSLAFVLYGLLMSVLSWMTVCYPVFAFQSSSSTTGWVTKISAAGSSALLAASKSANIATLSAAAASPAGSLAMKFITASPWIATGVAVGLVLYQAFYAQADLQAVKALAVKPAGWAVPGVTLPANAIVAKPCVAPYTCGGFDAIVNIPGGAPPGTSGCVIATPAMPAGWWVWGSNPQGDAGCVIGHLTGGANPPVATPATTGTQPEIAAVLATLPANNPLSLESKTTPQGVGSSPATADQTVTLPVTPSQVTTQTVPATQVAPTDTVVNKDATAPAGPAPTVTATQTTTGTSTTTTTTTTNGNTTTAITTTTDTDTAPVSSCSVGNHEPRTFGGILQTHLDMWKGSGLLSALNLLGTLVWPTTSPTYTLTSSFLGTFTFDFSAWAGMLLAIRSVIIAIAGFVAYKIIFVGGRA